MSIMIIRVHAIPAKTPVMYGKHVIAATTASGTTAAQNQTTVMIAIQ